MARQEFDIEELVSQIQRGAIRLPEMQRGYVWQGTKVRDLLDSLYRGYPSGTILTWESPLEAPIVTGDFAIDVDKEIPHQRYQLLLDGQQRLTSLTAIIRGKPVKVKNRINPIEILFNLEHPDYITIHTEIDIDDEDNAEDTIEEKDELQKEMTFALSSKKLKASPHWVAVGEVLNTNDNKEFLEAAGVTGWDDPRYNKYNDRLIKLRNIKSYKYDVYVLDSKKSYAEVTEIFVRVNSSGVRLKGSDLALAQITAKWSGSLKLFEEYQKKCYEAGFDIEIGTLVRNLVVFATGQSQFKRVNELSTEALKEAWEKSKAGFDYAMDFLKSNVGIDSSILLSSPYILITVAYFKNNHSSPEEIANLRKWVLLANMKGRYSRASSETYLNKDLKAKNENGLDTMFTDLRAQFGRLNVEAEDITAIDSRSNYFKTMFMAFRKDEAKSWGDGLIISFKHSSVKHKIQFHHIFPKSLLKGQNEEKINDISNLAFIGGGVNREISNKEPSDYLEVIKNKYGEKALTLQQIPIPINEENFWELGKYDVFLTKRRALIIARLNEFLEG
ncbi:MAG: DUF262 domain-containing protein [Alphaproteobacteria bacterium]|nr:DUF262 domain-containing protein [Alphaproteobacteria bacterium]